METGKVPIILPIYHEGTEFVMPQDPDTNALESGVPKVGKSVYVIVGNPLFIDDLLMGFNKCLKQDMIDSNHPICMGLYQALCLRIGYAMRLLRAQLRIQLNQNETRNSMQNSQLFTDEVEAKYEDSNT
eukprot:CAMPEP_0182443286 /NCGR_PEP_ID=MMETSP1172-20130603/2054_1 /TAXON_ID=708627 /ORGANISM="Timspurckia oligopyrenoides, Strain CCMP3278" /LENGTH=128 /DNA_ID=CAMNT_0024638509 /DNA_START=507 /DNA_END=890 /DNA_ORIENTATION=-